MTLIRWDPFRELEGARTRLNRMFGGLTAGGPYEEEPPLFTDWLPAVDIEETDKDYVVTADLPDLKKEEVKVTLEDGILTVEGERRHEMEEKGRKFHRVERTYGKFIRRFAMPTEIDTSSVKAEFKDGVLAVRLPKTVTAQSKAIEVKVA